MKSLKCILLVVAFIFSFSLTPLHARAAFEGEAIDNVSAWSSGINFISALTRSTGENMAQLSMKWITGIGDVLLGLVCPKCVVTAPEISDDPNIPDSMKDGLLGVVENQTLAMFQSQPNVDVVAHLAEEWVPGYKETQSVYASGYDDLTQSGIVTLWSFSRNIAYLCFVVIMIVIGFMIMFRNKIGGQALVTIGNTLPRVVISLVLVTFSFAIIGIILDVAGVFMRVIASPTFLDNSIPVHNIFDLIGGIFGSIPTGTAVFGGMGLAGVVLSITTVLGFAGPILLIVALILVGIIFIGALKLWFALLKSYLSILLNVIVAPLAIMSGAIPGNDAAIMNFFKSVLRNALVFPVAFAIVNLPYFLSEQNSVTLAFPETVVGDTTDFARIGPLVLGFAQIMAIYVAAQTPKFMLALIPSTASKAGADAAAAMKEGFSKIPMIGGLFK